MKVENGSVTGSAGFTMPTPGLEATAQTQTNLSILHLFSACSFAKRVSELEVEHSGKEFAGFWEDIFGHATAAVLLTVAALESYVNEVFANSQTNFSEVRQDILLILLEEYENKRLLDNFDLALKIKEAGKLSIGIAPTQDVLLLTQLRNALIHFKPKWDNEEREHAKVSDKLRGRFDKSPFLKSAKRIFPTAWASHGCCVWAIESAIAFVEEFEAKLSLPKRIEKFKPKFIYIAVLAPSLD